MTRYFDLPGGNRRLGPAGDLFGARVEPGCTCPSVLAFVHAAMQDGEHPPCAVHDADAIEAARVAQQRAEAEERIARTEDLIDSLSSPDELAQRRERRRRDGLSDIERHLEDLVGRPRQSQQLQQPLGGDVADIARQLGMSVADPGDGPLDAA